MNGPAAGVGSREADEARFGRDEAAGLVERTQVWFEVDVQPVAPGREDLSAQRLEESSSDPSTLVGGIDSSIEDESVRAPVATGVHEAHEPFIVEGADPADAVPTKSCRPGQDCRLGSAECPRVKSAQLNVIDREFHSHFDRAAHEPIVAEWLDLRGRDGDRQSPQPVLLRSPAR